MCGLVCAAIGRCPAEILKAAHIRPFAKYGTHELKDGISLHADIHQLFDAGRVAIDPEKLVLVMHPGLDQYPNCQGNCEEPRSFPALIHLRCASTTKLRFGHGDRCPLSAERLEDKSPLIHSPGVVVDYCPRRKGVGEARTGTSIMRSLKRCVTRQLFERSPPHTRSRYLTDCESGSG
ncbi:HNH endonuclease [Rhodococcus qingshengii]|jgi:hypothetical protein|uniref:HNH endonuclease n=1 Tax=Rhodococcus qingshengii TaxID=334542 RepID=UPI0036F41C48